MNKQTDWWEVHLHKFNCDGRNDACQGIFKAPHENSDDPQDESENNAYQSGFDAKRKELGDRFEWGSWWHG